MSVPAAPARVPVHVSEVVLPQQFRAAHRRRLRVWRAREPHHGRADRWATRVRCYHHSGLPSLALVPGAACRPGVLSRCPYAMRARILLTPSCWEPQALNPLLALAQVCSAPTRRATSTWCLACLAACCPSSPTRRRPLTRRSPPPTTTARCATLRAASQVLAFSCDAHGRLVGDRLASVEAEVCAICCATCARVNYMRRWTSWCLAAPW